MESELKSSGGSNNQASTSRLVFYANGALALGVLGLISANPQLANGWLYAALVMSVVGVLMSLAHLTSVEDFPEEQAEHKDFIDTMSSTLEEISETYDQIRSQLDESHKWSREHIDWWEDKIAMLNYALREGSLSDRTADDVRNVLTEFRSDLEELQNSSSESQVDLARVASELSANKSEIQKTIRKHNIWNDAQTRLFGYGETVARMLLLAAIVLGLVGIGLVIG